MASPGMTYGQLIVSALTRHPDRDAFVMGDRRVRYAAAAELTRRVAAALAVRGAGQGTGVVMLSHNSPECWLVQAAAYLLGARFSGLQPLGSVTDQVFRCDDAGATVLVVDRAHRDRGADLVARSASVRHLLVVDVDELDATSTTLAAGPARPHDVAWLQYTGGTTGRPKGVELPHRAMARQTRSILASWGVPRRPRYLATSPLTHAAVMPVLAVLLRGGTVVLQTEFEPLAWFDAVTRHRIDYALAVPSMIYALLDTDPPAGTDLSSLDTIVYGAAPMTPSRLQEGRERLGDVFHQCYGLSECAGTATSLAAGELRSGGPELLASCGRAVAGTEVAVLDDAGEPVPTGEVGELCVRGENVMLGYRNLPEQTAEALRDGWLRTSDLARQDDAGYCYVVDRKQDMIIVGELNVYAREVEDVLAAHPGVARAAVIGVPDERSGEAVHAVIVARDGHTLSAAELTAFVRRRKGPMYTPRSVDVVAALPTTPVGKVDKKALRARHRD